MAGAASICSCHGKRVSTLVSQKSSQYSQITPEIDNKIKNYVIIASLKSETMGKLINRIPGLHLLISSFSGSALSMLVEQAFSKPCLVNLISKDTHLVFSIS